MANRLGSFYFFCWPQNAPRMTAGAILPRETRKVEKKLRNSDLGWKRPFCWPGVDLSVAVREFVVGVRGSCPEDRWVFHLSALGVGIGEQRRIMTQVSQESVEGSWQVLKAWRAEAGPAVGVGGGPGSSRAQGPAPPGRQRPRALVRRGRTPKR